MAFTGEAVIQADVTPKVYSPCTLTVHPRDDRSTVISIRQNGVLELTRVFIGGGDPYVFIDDVQELYTACWPQCRFTFATDWEYNACKQLIKDSERVFGLRMLQETLERDIGIPVESLEDYAPLPRDWHPTAPTKGKLIQDNAPHAAGTDMLLTPQALHLRPELASLLQAVQGGDTAHVSAVTAALPDKIGTAPLVMTRSASAQSVNVLPAPTAALLAGRGSSATAVAVATYALTQAAKDKYTSTVKECVGVPMPITEGMRVSVQAVACNGDGKNVPQARNGIRVTTSCHDGYDKLFPAARMDPRMHKWLYKYTQTLGPYLHFFGNAFQPPKTLEAKLDREFSATTYSAKDLLPSFTPATAVSAGLVETEREATAALASMPQRRKCVLCKNTESMASSRRRLVGVHPLVPVDAHANPVFLCEHCNTTMLQRRAKGAQEDYLHDFKDGYENLCALCGAGGSEHRHLQLHCCSAKICPRSYCDACVEVLLPPKAIAAMKGVSEWLCPPCQSRHLHEIAPDLMAVGFPLPLPRKRGGGLPDLPTPPEPPAPHTTTPALTATAKRARQDGPNKPSSSAPNKRARTMAALPPPPAKTEVPQVVQNYDPAVYFAHYFESQRKRLLTKPEASEDECFACKDGGDVVECDFVSGGCVKCAKVYHQECLGFAIPDEVEKWKCPRHKCSQCGKSATYYCLFCPTSYCALHSAKARNGKPRLLPKGLDIPTNVTSFVCSKCFMLYEDAKAKGLLSEEALKAEADASGAASTASKNTTTPTTTALQPQTAPDDGVGADSTESEN